MEEIIELIKSTPNDSELGSKVRSLYYTNLQRSEELSKHLEGKWIYESPDGGKTVTKRLIGSHLSERITIKGELIEDWYKRDET